jgi:hypothetical protein
VLNKQLLLDYLEKKVDEFYRSNTAMANAYAELELKLKWGYFDMDILEFKKLQNELMYLSCAEKLSDAESQRIKEIQSLLSNAELTDCPSGKCDA